MSTDEENLAVLMQLGAAFDAQGFAGVMPFLHPEFEFHEPPEQPGATVFRGHDEVRKGFAKWAATWLEQRSELQSVDILPDGRVLAFTREHLVGRDGLRLEQDAGQLFTLRDGKVLRWQSFWDVANARAAAERPG